MKSFLIVGAALLLSAGVSAPGWARATDRAAIGVLRGTAQEEIWIEIEARHARCGGWLTMSGFRNFGKDVETYHTCMADQTIAPGAFRPSGEWRGAVAIALGVAPRDGTISPRLDRSLTRQCLARPTAATLFALYKTKIGKRAELYPGGVPQPIVPECEDRILAFYKAVRAGCQDFPKQCRASNLDLVDTLFKYQRR